MLQLKNIVKNYSVGSGDVVALNGVSLSFRDSEFVSVLGPSGCGKTTLLNIIGGLDRYTDGDLIINGVSTKSYRDGDWDTYRNHSIGFVFQSYNLIPHQSVLSNVELALTLSGVSKKERRQRSIEALEKVGLGDQINKKPNQMSGGQMQRVAIARALVNNPDILLADEPTGALDSTTSVQIMELLKEISQDKLVIMVTHNPDLAEQYSSRIVRVIDGKVVSDSDTYSDSEADDDADKKRMASNAELSANAEKAKHDKKAKKEMKRNKKGKKSMSFFTALSLSLNNLMTKKGRTFMTSFAGSIGIIGIALILALSTGVQMYIDTVQKDTLSSYPITIQNEEMDMTAIMLAMQDTGNGEDKQHEAGKIYADSSAYEMFNTLFSQDKKKNNLKDFKAWMEKELNEDTAKTDFSKYASAVHYKYNVDLNTYVQREDGKYVSTSLGSAMPETDSVTAGDMQSAFAVQMSASISSVNMWSEMLPGKNGALVSDMIYDQFDKVDGEWPTKANQVLLIVNKNNEVNDFVFYTLGMMSAEEFQKIMSAAATQKPMEVVERSASFEEILNTKFKLVLNAECYQDGNKDGIWEYIGDNESQMELVVKNAYDLEICGIIKAKEDVTATAVTGPFVYTSALTEYIIDKTNETEIARAQADPKNENYDVLTGLPFIAEEKNLTPAAKAEAFKEYVGSLNDKQKTELYTNILAGNIAAERLEKDIEDTYNMMLSMAEQSGSDLKTYIAQSFSGSYGMDAEVLAGYLSEYSEEELEKLMKEQIEAQKLAEYSEEAKATLSEIVYTPTDEEILQLSGYIAATLPEKNLQIGYLVNSLTTTTSMTAESAMAYLMGLDEAVFSELLSRTLYKEMTSMESEVAYQKIAGALDMYILGLDALEGEGRDGAFEALYDGYMPSGASKSTLEENYELLGIADKLVPSAISIYPDTFEDKDAIAELISDYNKTVAEDDKISYTDYMALLMSGVTSIINAVSYGLIAFVSISLVVSSIMIGIITYISVLERTKEIGILRAIGASKKDISRVFNAETLIVGFTAGMIGIIVSLLLCIPINIIIRLLSGVSVINAYLPVEACIVLVLISMGLTLIAGLFPSRVAARKDPVVALRTE